MKSYLDIRNWRTLSLILLFFVFIFTIANNYWFYTYVEYAVKKDVSQLELILNKDLEYFRTKKISNKNYREHTKIIIQQFAKKAQYNKRITLSYKNAILKSTGAFKKGYEPWRSINPDNRVVHSDINIVVPKLSSNEVLEYNNTVVFDKKVFAYSLFRSMTLSLTDVIIDRRNNIEHKYNLNAWTHWKKYYWPRSRNPTIFFIFLGFLLLRIRRYQIELYKELNKKKTELDEKKTELGKKQDEIDTTQEELDQKQKELTQKKDEIEKKQDEIKKLEKIIAKDQNEDIQKIISCAKNKELKELKQLLKSGISIDTKDSEGMTALMLYFLENNIDKDQREVMKILLDNDANINEKNHVGMTTLMLCSMRGANTSVQVLIDNGADTTIKQEVTAEDLATPSIKKLISKTKNNDPQALMKLLSNFTIEPMKHVVHDWKLAELENLTTFDEVMITVKKQFYSVEKELMELSPNLHRKIQLFLFSIDTDSDNSWFNNGKVSINIGWSNLDGIKEHCDSGNYTFDFKLKKDIRKSIIVNNKHLSTFGSIINLFKQEIEIRTDFNNLEKLFTMKQDELLLKGFNIDIQDSKLKRQFYTDTEKFSNAIKIIFDEIIKRSEYKNIEIFTRELKDRSIEIVIIQIDSSSTRSAKELLERTKEEGDISKIKECLTNLCDWSIESNYEDNNFRINILHSNNIDTIVELKEKPQGFTHILRFYR